MSQEGYPPLTEQCVGCGGRLETLEQMINPVSLRGRWECLCSGCVERWVNQRRHGDETQRGNAGSPPG